MNTIRQRLSIIAFLVVLVALFGIFLGALRPARAQAQRGIWLPGDALPTSLSVELATPLGATVDLTQYETGESLTHALMTMQEMGISWVRQEVRWDTVEINQGEYDWRDYDRTISAANDVGLRVVAVLNRTPAWARQASEINNPFAPPGELDPFVRFVEAAAQRYGRDVMAWQVWDEPNLMPHGGTEVIIDPVNYAAMLQATAPVIRAVNTDAIIVTAGLGPTLEPGGFNMSEVRFLDGLYKAGAAAYFDAVALKPYGFWTGASERDFSEEVLNFDRPVLVREVMAAHSDEETPIWFVEGGWAALPEDWQGDPPPWGSDSAERQRARLEEALTRTALEWQWVELMALQPFQPNVPADNPQTGLALVDTEGSLTALGEVTAAFGNDFYQGERGNVLRANWEGIERPALLRWDYALWLTVGAVGLLGLRLGWHMLRLPWGAWGIAFTSRPDWLQIGSFALLTMLFYRLDHMVFSLILYGAIGVLIAWRLQLGLAAVAFTLPFFLQGKQFGNLQFSLVELLLFLCVLAWGAHVLLLPAADWWFHRREGVGNDDGAGANPRVGERLRALLPRDPLDWAVLLFVLWAAASVPFAEMFGVASREFRVVVLGSTLYYWLLRESDETTSRWVIHGLIAGAAAVSCYGLYQWLFTTDVITAEGVRRIKGTYGSPNNLALFLERIVPVALALWTIGNSEYAPRGSPAKQGWWYAAALLPISACLFLTFSRGAWLLGLPAALLWVALWGGVWSRRVVIAVGIAGIIALLPFVSTERIAGLMTFGEGTGFLRLKLWQATVAMIRDHPLPGVGLDNFLYVYERYRLPEAWREPDLSHPHQIVLHFWAALGIPGLVLLIWQQVAFWRTWWRARHAALSRWQRALLIGIGGSMAATVAHGMIDNSYFLVDLAFVWMLTLALVAAMRHSNPEQRV